MSLQSHPISMTQRQAEHWLCFGTERFRQSIRWMFSTRIFRGFPAVSVPRICRRQFERFANDRPRLPKRKPLPDQHRSRIGGRRSRQQLLQSGRSQSKQSPILFGEFNRRNGKTILASFRRRCWTRNGGSRKSGSWPKSCKTHRQTAIQPIGKKNRRQCRPTVGNLNRASPNRSGSRRQDFLRNSCRNNIKRSMLR